MVIRSSRAKKFQPFEDVLLSRAYVMTSEDPIYGNDQSGPDFWIGVNTNFGKLLLEYDPVESENVIARDAWSWRKVLFCYLGSFVC